MLVDLVLSVLEDNYSQGVEVVMNQWGIHVIYEGTAVEDDVSDDEMEPTMWRGDRLSYRQVLKLADYIVNNWTRRTVGSMLGEPKLAGLDGVSLPRETEVDRGSRRLSTLDSWR
jgi:hypothetical protein